MCKEKCAPFTSQTRPGHGICLEELNPYPYETINGELDHNHKKVGKIIRRGQKTGGKKTQIDKE